MLNRFITLFIEYQKANTKLCTIFLILFWMFEAKRPIAINVTNLQKMQASPTTSLRDHSPGISLRRRRTKVEKMVKTNEELIQQSHEMLMNYVDSIDVEIRHLMDNHEAQFLVAYREHSTKVKEEMKQVKKQMLENSQNQQQFLDRIRFLEKELIIFREETLNMSEKLIAKNEQIQNLKIRLKEVTAENKQQKASIVELTKTGMSLSARLQGNDKSSSNGSQLIDLKFIPNKCRHEELKHFGLQSPPNFHLKSYTAQLRTRSIQKRQKLAASKIISSTIQQKQYETIAPSSLQADDKIESIKTDLSNDRKKSSFLKSKFERSRVIETQIQKLRSKSFASRNQYEKIFIDCVEEVRKNIMRKDFAQSLNYFKQNGPKNLIQFRKLDYFVLLQLFFKKGAIMQQLFELIFGPQAK